MKFTAKTSLSCRLLRWPFSGGAGRPSEEHKTHEFQQIQYDSYLEIKLCYMDQQVDIELVH